MSPRKLYAPLYQPWLAENFDPLHKLATVGDTLIDRSRLWVIDRMVRQTEQLPGDVIELGVYKGGSAALIAAVMETLRSTKTLHLVDSFQGLPSPGSQDTHKRGDFADTSLAQAQGAVRYYRKHTRWHVGWIPEVLPSDLVGGCIAFAHVDVDLYQSVYDSLEWLWPRMNPAGVIIFDDYGFPTCPGALAAVDDFFHTRQVYPLALQTGQALVITPP